MTKKEKIGRNDYCPCGSGLKYKKCHLLMNTAQLPLNVPLSVLRELRRKKNAQQLADKIRKKELGEVRPIISCDAPYGKLVAIGSKIYKTSLDADFYGFILEHALQLLGEKWIREELAKRGTENLICKWYSETFCNMKEAKKQKQMKQNFSFRPLLSLAYDLFILNDNMLLQSSIVDRLKHHDQFAAARYELYVAATCIRAGFDIEFENEKDRSSRHVEFVAKHKITGQAIFFEAKRSHSSRHNYGKLINDALGKAGELPLIIFVDINKSPDIASRYLIRNNPRLNLMLTDRIKLTPERKDIYNLIVFTNHPYQFATIESPKPEPKILIVESDNPQNEINDKKVVDKLRKAIQQYGNIPKEFPKQ